MKNLFYILLLTSQIFFGQTDFEKGNRLYQNGKYEQAVEAYKNILKANKNSAELYFNLGNCYYKLNKVALSIYNYEKALVLNPKDTESANNLKFAQKRTIDEIKVLPKVGFSRLLQDFTEVYDYNTWAWISVIFAAVFLLFFLGYYLSHSTALKRVFFLGMFALLLLILISVGSAIFEKSLFDNEKPAIVFSETLDLRSEPQKASGIIFVLHEGTKVFVTETVDRWVKVQLSDGMEGWIEKNGIEKIK